jgi:hypothetical protein
MDDAARDRATFDRVRARAKRQHASYFAQQGNGNAV